MAFLLQGGKTIVPLTKCIGDKEGAYHNPVLQEFFESGQFNRHFGNTQFIRHPKALIKQSSLQSYGQYIPQEIDPDSLFYITGFVVVAIAAGLLMLSRKMRKNQATVAVSASLTIVFILSSIVLWIS
ncbi:hypothetical protein BDR26DRAFT_849257 [Obelidium mucronatum]|nr:hypothetical protein BDR26DRAFT_849257 [Obelidium mucronatum]